MKVFISYRRNDTAPEAGRLYDGLAKRFGNKRVFKDIDSLQAGVDFRVQLNEALSKADAVVVLIGEHWLTDSNGNRRIENPDDFVRIEIEVALARGVPVIPLLVGSGELPPDEALPESLRALLRRHALPLRPDPDFRSDLRRLIAQLEKLEPRSKSTRWWAIAAILVVLLAAVCLRPLAFRRPAMPIFHKQDEPKVAGYYEVEIDVLVVNSVNKERLKENEKGEIVTEREVVDIPTVVTRRYRSRALPKVEPDPNRPGFHRVTIENDHESIVVTTQQPLKQIHFRADTITEISTPAVDKPPSSAPEIAPSKSTPDSSPPESTIAVNPSTPARSFATEPIWLPPQLAGDSFEKDPKGNPVFVWLLAEGMTPWLKPEHNAAAVRGKNLAFLQKVHVVYTQLVDGEPAWRLLGQVEDGTMHVKHWGWVNEQFCLLRQVPRKPAPGIRKPTTPKVILAKSFEQAQAEGSAKAELLLAPSSTATKSQQSFPWFTFLFALREVNGFVLLGTRQDIDIDDQPDAVAGWLPRTSVWTWNGGEAFSWDFESTLKEGPLPRTQPAVVFATPEKARQALKESKILPNGTIQFGEQEPTSIVASEARNAEGATGVWLPHEMRFLKLDFDSGPLATRGPADFQLVRIGIFSNSKHVQLDDRFQQSAANSAQTQTGDSVDPQAPQKPTLPFLIEGFVWQSVPNDGRQVPRLRLWTLLSQPDLAGIAFALDRICNARNFETEVGPLLSRVREGSSGIEQLLGSPLFHSPPQDWRLAPADLLTFKQKALILNGILQDEELVLRVAGEGLERGVEVVSKTKNQRGFKFPGSDMTWYWIDVAKELP